MKRKNKTMSVISILLVSCCVGPYLYVFIKTFLQTDGGGTLEFYYKALFATSQFLRQFWKSLLYGILIVAGQVLVSIFAGYGFAKYHFKGKNVMFLMLMILMILPVQVTLVPNYMLMYQLELLDTFSSIALPAMFLPLGTFIMTQSFRAISSEIIDAAKLDGCNLFEIIFKIVVPITKNGIVCVALLAFLDSWNMVEQPIVFFKDFHDYPLSVALASIQIAEPAVQYVCCFLVILPPLFLFTYFNNEIIEGIAVGREK